jgi:hypothetical protein
MSKYEFEFEGNYITVSFIKSPFEEKVKILSKKDLKYPFFDTDFINRTLTEFEYISQKTGDKCYAYQISDLDIDDSDLFTVFTCQQKINNIAGMIKFYDKENSDGMISYF